MISSAWIQSECLQVPNKTQTVFPLLDDLSCPTALGEPSRMDVTGTGTGTQNLTHPLGRGGPAKVNKVSEQI